MSLVELSSARNHFELCLLDNVIQGRVQNGRLARAFESSIAESHRQDASAVALQARSVELQSRTLESTESLRVLAAGIGETMGSLLSLVDSGFTDLAYQHRLTNSSLIAILEVLQAPLDMRARELRRRAEEAFANGWLDEATADFEQSEQLNRYDFTVHQALGTIAYSHQSNLDEAIKQFALAAKYAQPKSTTDYVYALLSQAAAHEKKDDLGEAYRLAKQALETPDSNSPEAHYAVGRYGLATSEREYDAVECLVASFWGNPALTIVANSDQLLQDSQAELQASLEMFRDQLSQKVAEHLSMLASYSTTLMSLSAISDPPLFASLRKEIATEVAEPVEALHSGNTIAGQLEAIRILGRKVPEMRRQAREIAEARLSSLRDSAQNLERWDREQLSELESSSAWANTPTYAWAIIGIGVGLLAMGKLAGYGSLIFWINPVTCGLVGFAAGHFTKQARNQAISAQRGRHHPGLAKLKESAHRLEAALKTL